MRYSLRRRAFSLVELLVVITIILMLMGLIGAAVSAARGGQKKQATRAMIAKLDTILQRQWDGYSARYVSSERLNAAPGYSLIGDKAAARAWYLRRNIITADMPDRWSDVKYLADNTNYVDPRVTNPIFPESHLTAAQRAYVGIWRNFTSGQQQSVGDQYAGAECLFMIIMQGGVANCLECAGLKTADIGDKDGDGAPEFHDAWGNPIGYILWPAAVELPAGTGTRFFSGARQLCSPIGPDDSWNSRPIPGADGTMVSFTPTLGMKPLIYSAGPDGEYGYERSNEARNLDAGSSPVGRDCGNFNAEPCRVSGQPIDDAGQQHVLDNLTNLDQEAKR